MESELIDGVRAVARGDIYIQSGLRQSQVEGISSSPKAAAGDVSELSPPERQLLALMAMGATSHEAADALELDPAELESLRASLGSKLGLRSRVELARFAREHGLI